MDLVKVSCSWTYYFSSNTVSWQFHSLIICIAMYGRSEKHWHNSGITIIRIHSRDIAVVQVTADPDANT